MQLPTRDPAISADRFLPAVAVAAGAAALATGVALVRRLRQERAQREAAQRPLLEEAARKAQTAGLSQVGTAADGVDDLKVIEGIGPRAESALREAGIERYEQLASLKPGRIRTLLRARGGRMSDPATWPEQARLAASGQWQELRTLQAQLVRGRRRRAAAS